jgi:hypothetical protein
MNSSEKAAKQRYIQRLRKQIEVNDDEQNNLTFLGDGGVFYLSDIIFSQKLLLEYLENRNE